MIKPAIQPSLVDDDSDERALYERLCGKAHLDDLMPTLSKDAASIR